MKTVLISLALVLGLTCHTFAKDADKDVVRHDFAHFSLDLPPDWKILDEKEAVTIMDATGNAVIIVIHHALADGLKVEDGASLFCRSLVGDGLQKIDETTYTFAFYRNGFYRSLFTAQGNRFYWISYTTGNGLQKKTIDAVLRSIRYAPATTAN